jgi:hypothetical protein
MGRNWFFPFKEAHFLAYLLQGASSLRMSWAVQAAADWVTETNNRDGVALAIARLQATGWL